ncbi:hypothetical protein C8R47DRAFT_1325784 [Mycena vitilis]|nr:hypothetical protein C8R47DRAFT_1325784 [Mycena vitilis]
MHPALSIDNLSRLPGRYKLMATSAANGSLRDLRRVCSYLGALGENDQLLLPIFYRSLEPAKIPRTTDLDSLTSSAEDCCACAGMSLDCIVHLIRTGIDNSPDLTDELWPRIWAWMEFLHRYRDIIPAVLGGDPLETYSTYGELIAHFALDLIGETPGLKAVITAVWKVLLGVGSDYMEGTYQLLSRLITPVGMSQSETHLMDLVEGAGGTVHDLVSLLLLHIRCSVWTPQSPVPPATLNSFLFNGVRVVGSVSGGGGPADSALLASGVERAMIRALCSFKHSELPWQSFDTTFCFVFHPILHFIGCPPGYPAIRRALKAGLLRLVFHRAQQSETVSMWLTRLLKEILLPMTVYHSCLTELQKNFAELADLEVEGSLEFQQSRIFPEWSRFATVARARIRLMDECNAGEYRAQKGCSNMDCGIIKLKTDFRRCSGCEEAYYCSIDCQAADWRAGHHESCHELSLARRERFGMRSRRDTAFLRTLVHSDYQRSRETILVQHMFEGRAHPPSFSAVCLDYTGLPEYQLTAPQKLFPPPETALEREHERRLNSGRMQICQVTFAEGRDKARVLFPMHISNTAVRSELRRIGSVIPESEDKDLASLSPELRDEINTLLALEVEEIH